MTAVDTARPPTNLNPTPSGDASGGGSGHQPPAKAHPAPNPLARAAGSSSATDSDHWLSDVQPTSVGSVADSLLLILADQLDDAEQSRVAAENRYRSLTTTWKIDGDTYGKGINPDLPECLVIADHVQSLRQLEHKLTLALCRAMRRHPLGGWVKRTVGVGEKQAARLLAAIGDPATRQRPSQLWAYCGLHVLHPGHPIRVTHSPSAGVDPIDGQAGVDTHSPHAVGGHPTDHGPRDTHRTLLGGVAPARRKNQKANWNTTAKTRIYLIAESCIKQTGTGDATPPSDSTPRSRRRSPYRHIYDDGRAKYADAVHHHPCPRCGPSGNPAPAGSPLSAGHQHARAMRLVMKRILLDLWREARRLREPS